MKLPSEKILQYIEERRKITIERNHYAAEEYYNHKHHTGKNTPAFLSNNGVGDGKHTKLVEIDAKIYVVLASSEELRGKQDISGPIPFLISGRTRK